METKIVRLENNQTDLNRLVKYLYDADSSFDIPLSKKMDIQINSQKKLNLGRVLAIEENGKIAAIIEYYCNDLEHHRAYTTLYSARKDIQQRGLSKNLIYYMCLDCKKEGMNEVRFSVTDRRVLILHRRMGGIVVSEETINGIWVAEMSCALDVYIKNFLRIIKPDEFIEFQV